MTTPHPHQAAAPSGPPAGAGPHIAGASFDPQPGAAYQQAPYQQAPFYQQAPQMHAGARNNVLAIAAFVMALMGISLPAVICGYMARQQILRSAGLEQNRWMATAAIVVGGIGVAFWTLIVLLALVSGGSDYSSSSYTY
jgi:hypothetical protein